jgi:uncharacterized GH25 family protein
MLVLAGALAPGAMAHEFWILPEDFSPRVGEPVPLQLLVGDGLDQGRPYARNPRHLKSFRLRQGGRETPVLGLAGADPAGIVRIEEPGIAVVAYASTHTRITLPADAFEAYLREEGLERVARQRAQAGQSTRPGSEAFRRCAKALLLVGGDAAARGYDRPVGLALELIPLRSPFFLPQGGRLPLLLLYGGAPLAGAKVKLFQAGRPEAEASARTDGQGRAELTLAAPGMFMISAVHMVSAEGLDADWESIWSSLTFEIPTEIRRTPMHVEADERYP